MKFQEILRITDILKEIQSYHKYRVLEMARVKVVLDKQ
jgi:hypothetical protein